MGRVFLFCFKLCLDLHLSVFLKHWSVACIENLHVHSSPSPVWRPWVSHPLQKEPKPSPTSTCGRLPCASEVPSLPSFPQHHRLIVSVLKLVSMESQGGLSFTRVQGEHPWIPSPACILEQRHRWHFTTLKGREMRASESTFCVLTHRTERPGTREQGGDKETRWWVVQRSKSTEGEGLFPDQRDRKRTGLWQVTVGRSQSSQCPGKQKASKRRLQLGRLGWSLCPSLGTAGRFAGRRQQRTVYAASFSREFPTGFSVFVFCAH